MTIRTFFALSLISTAITLPGPAYPADTGFAGAMPDPMGHAASSVTQLRISFPDEIVKDANQENFQVTCAPAAAGFSGWQNNDTLWTFDFQAPEDYESPQLAGGTKCQVTQIADIKSVSGIIWPANTINYQVEVAGPNVQSAAPAYGFQGDLREADPVLLLTFDGPVNRDRFFAEQDAYLNYTSSNAPSEKIPLTPVPDDQQQQIFDRFKMTDMSELKYADRTWILATTKQNLIPGSQVSLTVENQVSAQNSDVHAYAKFTKQFKIRSQFQAEVQCANPASDGSSCLPRSQISIMLNGMVKWTDIQNAYIEYLPYKSSDKRTVRSFAEIDSSRKLGFWDEAIYELAYYFPFLSSLNDTVLDSIVFNVNIEPQTTAKIILPAGLKDIDGRVLAATSSGFDLRIAAMTEVIHTPKELSFFERKVSPLFLPVSVVNLNQELQIRKTGRDSKTWEPVRDVPTMIRLVRAYAARGGFRSSPSYTSPMDQLGIASNVSKQNLTGPKNRPALLQLPFAQSATAATTPTSGMYPVEISSPTLELSLSDPSQNHYFNPKYVLAQVTDLTVHLKKGVNQSLAWVTHLSNAQPAAGARLEIFNCLGERVASFAADANGLVSFPNRQWAKSCNGTAESGDGYSYFDPTQFYASAQQGDDLAVIHSSWNSLSSDPMGAPGVDFFWSDIQDDQPHFHAVIGVNLVKPGQQVPVEIVAKTPSGNGFQDVPANLLPNVARVVSSDDDDTFYEMPLQWANGKAEFTWNVPNDSSVHLGTYSIELKSAAQTYEVTSGDIEVGEFKIPLMSGIISFPTQTLVQPDSIPVNSSIRYANGVGAKNLPVALDYYFTPTSLMNKALPNFEFGTGPMTATDATDVNGVNGAQGTSALPTSSRPTTISGLHTADDGSLTKDIAHEPTADGRSVADALKNVTRPQKLVVRARYLDQVGEFQTLSQAKDVFNSSAYVGTHVVGGAREEARLEAAVVNVNGDVIISPTGLDYKLIRVDTRIIGEELYGGLIKNSLERELEPVHWKPACALAAGSKTLECPIGALKEGTYAFEVTLNQTIPLASQSPSTPTPAGASAAASGRSSHSVFKVDSDGKVYGPNEYYNFGDDEGSRQLPLALDKKSYRDGDSAIVSFAPPFKTCRALVTIERSDVMSSFVVPEACGAGRVELPIDASMAPNAFVSVYLITGRPDGASPKPGERDLARPTYKLGYANMKIEWSRFKSNVTVKTDRGKYEPGQTVNVSVSVSPAQGKLQGGTVTLVALEEKILELKKNDTYRILDALMQMRADEVNTITALERIETTTSQNADLPDDPSARKGGDEGGDGSSKAEFKRQLFNALVAFQPDVPVQNGVAKFSFKANDSLTRFKIFAVSIDSSQKFGLGEAEYLSEQDTQIYSNIPSVAHAGDSYPIRVTLQNNSKRAGTFKIVVTETVKEASGAVLSTQTYTKNAPVGTSTSSAIDVAQASVDGRATRVEYITRVYDQDGKLVDTLQSDPQTVLPTVPLEIHDSLLFQMGGASFSQAVVKDPSAIPGAGELKIYASKSLVDSAVSQITQRMDQDWSSDFFIETRLDKALLESSEANPAPIRSVLGILLGYTDDNGFLKYQPQSNTGNLWFTASVLQSLAQQPWALKTAPPALIDKLKGAVSQVLSKSVNPDYVGSNPSPMDWMRAQVGMGRAAFALASSSSDSSLTTAAKQVNETITENLARDPKAYGQPEEQWSNIDLVERWLLEAYASPQSAKTSNAYRLLTAPSRLVYSGNMAQLTGSPSDGSFYSDETIVTSRLLLGVALLQSDATLAKNLALGLVGTNKKGWYNLVTMTNVAQSLMGFDQAFESEPVTGSITLSIPEEGQSTSIDFDRQSDGNLSTPWTQPQATLQAMHSGSGLPWLSIQALSAIPLTAPVAQGLSIERTLRNVTRDSGGAQAGDVLEVTLNVRANSSLKQIVLFDPIPAASNILSDAYGDYSSGEKSYAGYKLYFELLPNGTTTVKYQLQLNNPGVFNLPPTRAEGIYMPSIFAETPNDPVKVQ